MNDQHEYTIDKELVKYWYGDIPVWFTPKSQPPFLIRIQSEIRLPLHWYWLRTDN